MAVINANHTRKISSKFRPVTQYCHTNVSAERTLVAALLDPLRPLEFAEV